MNLATRVSSGLAALVLLAGTAAAQGLEDDFQSGAFDMPAPPPMPAASADSGYTPPAMVQPSAPAAPTMTAPQAGTTRLPVPGQQTTQRDADSSFLKELANAQKQLQLLEARQKALEVQKKVRELESEMEDTELPDIDDLGRGQVAVDRDVSEFDPIVVRVRGVGGSLVARVRTAYKTEVTVGPGDQIPGGFVVRSVNRNGVNVLTPKGKAKLLAFGTGSGGNLAPQDAQAGSAAALASGGQLGLALPPPSDLGAPSTPLGGGF